jgi:YD repeat-containing protein
VGGQEVQISLYKYICTAIAVLLLGASSSARSAMPAVSIASAPIVSPSAALSYYGSPASPAAPTTRDPLVQEITRALRYDIDLIFAHVRDNVEYVPIFGVQKGARGVVLDGAGSDFDQAQFLVEALREADAVNGSSYAPAYKMGQITLSAAEFAAWTGVDTAAVAIKFLAYGGIPAVVTGSGSSFTVVMEHVWVTAKVGATTYVFDPSYKPHTVASGTSWVASMGYSQSSLLAAGGGANATEVDGFNATAFRAVLNGYRASVESHLASTARGMRASAAFGESNIVAHPASENRRTSLPYVTSTDRTWAGQIPDKFRASFTVSLSGTSYGTFYADTVGEQALVFTYNYVAATNSFVPIGNGGGPVLGGSFLNDCDQYLGSQPAATPAVATIAINHPYAANSGSYADRTLTKQFVSKKCTTGQFYISSDWGATGAGTLSRIRPAASRLRYNPANTFPFILGPTIANVARQYADWLNLASFVQPSFYQVHDLIGVFTLDNVNNKLSASGSSTYDLSTFLSVDFEAAVSAIAKDNTVAGDTAAAYMAGLGLSYAEAAVPRQESDAVYDMAAVTLVTQQDARATTAGTYSTYLATPASWDTVKTNLTQYPTGSTGAMQSYVNESYSLLVPEFGSLRQPQIAVPIYGSNPVVDRVSALWEGKNTYGDGGEFVRSAFLAWHPGANTIPDRIALVIYDPRHGRVLKGGVGVAIDSAGAAIRKPDQPKGIGKDVIRSALSVDGRSGALTYSPPADLVDGAGDFPFSLSLRRIYDQREGANYGFGTGWRSSWTHVASMSNDGVAALGGNGAQAVASALVAQYAIGNLVTTQDAQHLYAALQVVNWLADQTINNVVTISSGLDGEQSFFRQQAGGFVSANSNGSKLTQTGVPEVAIINRRLYSQVAMAYVDQAGTTRSYGYLSSPCDEIDVSSPAIAGLCSAKALYLSTWAWPNGVNISASYVSTFAVPDVTQFLAVANNLGTKIELLSYDYGARTETPTCPEANSPPVYTPVRPAAISYKTSTGQATSLSMDAQVGFTLIGDPDTAMCDAQKRIPTKKTNYLSFANRFTDAVGSDWRFGKVTADGIYDSYTALGTLYKPSQPSTADATVTYGQDDHVRSVGDLGGNDWSYFSSPYRAEVLSPVQAVSSAKDGAVTYFDRWGNRSLSIDPLGRTTTMVYDKLGRVTTSTSPAGDSMVTAYDARSNVVQRSHRAVPGSPSLPPLVSSTTYYEGPTVAICVTPARCNKPSSDTDANSNTTDYVWNTYGNLISVTKPADAGGVRPTTTLGYTSFTGSSPRVPN